MTTTTKRARTKKRTTKRSSAWPALLLLPLALIACLTLSAQKKPKAEDANTRSVQGTVFDAQDHPVPQAVVQLEDTRSLQVRSFITENDGTYHFSGLKADVDYRLKAMFKDTASGVKTFSVFDSRKTGVYNLKLDQKAKPPDSDKK